MDGARQPDRTEPAIHVTRELNAMAYDNYEIWHTYDRPNPSPVWPFPSGWWYRWYNPDRRSDSEPVGPFQTYQEAARAVQDTIEQAEAQRSQNK